MTFFDKIFISSYNFFKRGGREDSRFAAICLLLAIQIAFLTLPLLILKVLFQSTFLSSLHHYSKLIAIPIIIFWILIHFENYGKKKTGNLYEEYSNRSESFRRFWNWLPFLILIFFIIVLFLLVILNEHMQKT